MADYAKKGRPKAPAKKTANGKAKAEQAGAPRPRLWFMLAIVLIAVGGFSYFLFYIDGKAEQNPVATTAKPTKKTEPPTDQLPQVPEKKWQYIDQLRDKEVIVDVPEQQVSTRQFRLQCASYKSLNQADGLKAKIAFQGYETQIKQVRGSKGDWYQVYLGPFDNRRAAEAVRHRMQRARINGCQIYYWEG